MMRRLLLIFFILMFFCPSMRVDASMGGIGSSYMTKVCHDATCTTPSPGTINFKPTGVSPVLIDSVTGISGQVWGDELGWITLNPTGSGVTFADVATGLLTGKAWSQVAGWINFSVTDREATINPVTGEFSGWAWSGGPYGGWIPFDCSNSGTCVRTTWKPSAGGSSSGGGGVASPSIDVCPNIEGTQASLPQGYTVDDIGSCVFLIDVCPNLPGVQGAAPTGFIINDIGSCEYVTDYCPNISGVQQTVPQGYVVSQIGICIPIARDACPTVQGLQADPSECAAADACFNLPGIQASIPDGYGASGKTCVPEAVDMCPNISGNQISIPADDAINDAGQCIAAGLDQCPNLGGVQTTVPVGFFIQNGGCLFTAAQPTPDAPSEAPAIASGKIIAFSFIPTSMLHASNNHAIKSITFPIVELLGGATDETYQIDLVSVGIATLAILFLLFVIFRLLTKL